MIKVLIVLGCSLTLSGCCAGLRESVKTYGRFSAENVETLRILVERCRDQDLEACDGALQALELQRLSTETLSAGTGT